MPKGKKSCPECDTELGAATRTCPECDYNFSRKNKIKPKKEPIKETSEQEVKPLKTRTRNTKIRNYTGDPIPLANLCRGMSPMRHLVKDKLMICFAPVIESHDFEPELKFNALYSKLVMDTETGDLSVFFGTIDQEKPDIIYKNMVKIGSGI